MKIICTPFQNGLDAAMDGVLEIVLYGYADHEKRGDIGARIGDVIRQKMLLPDVHAWDLMSIALSVIAADTGVRRDESPDGWTRPLDIQIAVTDPTFWNSHKGLLEDQLRYLTNDLWQCNFVEGGYSPVVPDSPVLPDEDCVALLSGGLDSLVGTVDLVTQKDRKPVVVSQITQGDKEKQSDFAASIGGGLRHLQLNHNVRIPGPNERSQRARSLIFLAYGVLAATTLKRYHEGDRVTLFMCENGFMSINPPLTDGRIGSLSTRTTHPIFLKQFQELLDVTDLRVDVNNPYQFRTKGEMLKRCADQDFLNKKAHLATSCGRYARFNYRHCGRCIPCLVRRSAIRAWGQTDKTSYVYEDLSRNDADHAGFDDVRSAAMAVAEVKVEGLDSWLRTSLSSTRLGDVTQYKETVGRGLKEIESFLGEMGVR